MSKQPEIREELQLRVHGDASKPTLIYLPGLHGDWTLVSGFRSALHGRARFVEFTYPRTLIWSLEDYAAAIEQELAARDIHRGWLLGESFGSQILWTLVGRRKLTVDGIILAGGFVRHPIQWGVRLAERIAGGMPLGIITRVLMGYAKVARFRYRRSPETLATIHEFIARRTELDRRAATHRLRLIAGNDPRPIARQATEPVYALAGVLDPIVPAPSVRHWLKQNCPGFREFRILWRADHNVLGTAPADSAALVLRWMNAAWRFGLL